MKLHQLGSALLVSGSLGSLFCSTGIERANPYFAQSGKFGGVEVVGVCDPRPDDIRCWTPAGKPDKRLSQAVSSYFLVSSNFHLELAFRCKTRLVLIRYSLKTVGCCVPNVETHHLRRGFGSIPVDTDLADSGVGTAEIFYRYPDKGENSFDVSGRAYGGENPFNIPAKVGAQFDLPEGRVTLARIERVPSRRSDPQHRPMWRITWSSNTGSEDIFEHFYTTSIGNNNNSVRVDLKGNPIKAPMDQPFVGLPMEVMYLGGPAREWYIYANPAKLKTLSITPAVSWNFEIKNIALEPAMQR